MNWYTEFQSNAKTDKKDTRVKYLTYTLIGLCVLSILITVCGAFFKETIVESITNSSTAKGASIDYSTVLMRYGVMLSSFVRMTILLIVSVALIIAGLKLQSKKEQLRYIVIILIAITAIDLGISASRFIQYYDYRETYGLDPITAFLKNDPSYYRVKLYSRHPFLDNLTNFKFKYYEIPTWDVAASRLPKLYNNFLIQIADTNFGTFLDVGNVKYMLGDRPLNHPAFRQVYSSNGFYINQYLGFVPRVFTISKFIVVKDEDQAIKIMSSPEFNVRNGVIVEENPGIVSSATTDYNPVAAEITQYTPNRVTIRTQTNIPSLLVFHDYYTPDWKAFVDNKPTKVLKTDYLMRSVVVPAGTHTVVFDYQPNMIGLYISAICLILFAGGLVYYIQRIIRKKRFSTAGLAEMNRDSKKR